MRSAGQGRGADAEALVAWGLRQVTTWMHEERLASVHAVVRECGARTVIDLGCGDGDLLVRLAREPQIVRAVGVDICGGALDRLRARLEALGKGDRAHIELVHGSMIDAGPRLKGFDCAVLLETIEHIDPDRLSVVERAVLTEMRPGTVVMTTPNAEFNALLGVPAHRFRHPDHRFEWDRPRFQRWVRGVADRQGYKVVCRDIAGCHPAIGGASQMAVFTIGL